MGSHETTQPESLPDAVMRCRPALLAASASILAAQFLVAAALAAQTPTPAQPAPVHPAPASRAAHPHKKPAAAQLTAQPAAQPVPLPAPVAPPLPNWPANKTPDEASVVWDSRGLFIQASNSSLDQILKEVSLKTGARVEGMGADERIFGNYGPGSAREVLSELLEDSGYNVFMVGDLGEGTPRRIVLSGRATTPSQPSGNANPAASGNNDSENDQEAQQAPEPEQAQPQAPAYQPGPAAPVRTPQQIFQERQQQMMQLQQQQQQRNNQQPPQ